MNMSQSKLFIPAELTSELTWCRTLRLLFHDESKLVVLTSTSVRDQVESIYSKPPLGPVKETQVQVEHAGGISNEFGCWTNVRLFSLLKCKSYDV